MKLLHVADLHYRREWFQWVLSQAASYDAVCIAGDLIDLFQSDKTPIRQQVLWVRQWIREYPGLLFACSGNHDFWQPYHGIKDTDAWGGWLRKMSTPRIAVDKSVRQFEGVTFACLPWLGAPPDDITPGDLYILSHCPPAGTAVARSGRDDGGTTGFQRFASMRACILCGHIHTPERWWDRIGSAVCLNPGYLKEAVVPPHIVIDTAANTARYIRENRPLEEIPLFQMSATS